MKQRRTKRKGDEFAEFIGRVVQVPSAEWNEDTFHLYPGKIVKRDSKPRNLIVVFEDGSRFRWPVEQLQKWLDDPLLPSTTVQQLPQEAPPQPQQPAQQEQHLEQQQPAQQQQQPQQQPKQQPQQQPEQQQQQKHPHFGSQQAGLQEEDDVSSSHPIEALCQVPPTGQPMFFSHPQPGSEAGPVCPQSDADAAAACSRQQQAELGAGQAAEQRAELPGQGVLGGVACSVPPAAAQEGSSVPSPVTGSSAPALSPGSALSAPQQQQQQQQQQHHAVSATSAPQQSASAAAALASPGQHAAGGSLVCAPAAQRSFSTLSAGRGGACRAQAARDDAAQSVDQPPPAGAAGGAHNNHDVAEAREEEEEEEPLLAAANNPSRPLCGELSSRQLPPPQLAHRGAAATASHCSDEAAAVDALLFLSRDTLSSQEMEGFLGRQAARPRRYVGAESASRSRSPAPRRGAAPSPATSASARAASALAVAAARHGEQQRGPAAADGEGWWLNAAEAAGAIAPRRKRTPTSSFLAEGCSFGADGGALGSSSAATSADAALAWAAAGASTRHAATPYFSPLRPASSLPAPPADKRRKVGSLAHLVGRELGEAHSGTPPPPSLPLPLHFNCGTSPSCSAPRSARLTEAELLAALMASIAPPAPPTPPPTAAELLGLALAALLQQSSMAAPPPPPPPPPAAFLPRQLTLAMMAEAAGAAASARTVAAVEHRRSDGSFGGFDSGYDVGFGAVGGGGLGVRNGGALLRGSSWQSGASSTTAAGGSGGGGMDCMDWLHNSFVPPAPFAPSPAAPHFFPPPPSSFSSLPAFAPYFSPPPPLPPPPLFPHALAPYHTPPQPGPPAAPIPPAALAALVDLLPILWLQRPPPVSVEPFSFCWPAVQMPTPAVQPMEPHAFLPAPFSEIGWR